MAASSDQEERDYTIGRDILVILKAMDAGSGRPNPETFARLARKYEHFPEKVIRSILPELSMDNYDGTSIGYYIGFYEEKRELYSSALERMVSKFKEIGHLGRGGAKDWFKFEELNNDPQNLVPDFLINKIVKEGLQNRYSSTLAFLTSFYEIDPLDNGVDLKFDPEDPNYIDFSPAEITELKQEFKRYGDLGLRSHRYKHAMGELDRGYITLQAYDYLTEIKRSHPYVKDGRLGGV